MHVFDLALHLQTMLSLFLHAYIQELIASQAQRKRSCNSETRYEEILSRRLAGKERTKTEVSARAVHQWLKKSHSPLRDLFACLSDGVSFFSPLIHTRARAGSVSHRAACKDAHGGHL